MVRQLCCCSAALSRLLRRRATAAAAAAPPLFGYPCLPACNFSSWRVEV